MTQFQWKINQMVRKTDNNFVFNIFYSATAIDENYVAENSGTIGYQQKEEIFIPFEELTEDIVLQWVYDSVGKQKIESFLQNQIEAKKNPEQKSGLPW